MRKLLGTVLTFFCLLNAAPARADESAAKSRIVAVGLFKNGLAVIKREVTLGKAGKYVLDDVPEPVHGTYWIESIAPVESSVEMREVEVPVNELVPANLQEDLAGKKVTIHFKGDKAPPANGTVTKLKTLKSAKRGVASGFYASATTPAYCRPGFSSCKPPRAGPTSRLPRSRMSSPRERRRRSCGACQRCS